MAVDTNCSVTNSSGKSIVVLNAFNSSTNVANKSTKQGYEQDLKALSFGASGTMLGDGATGAVTLNETYTDSKGQTQPCYIYDLLISRPDSLFPVMAVGESLDWKKLTYPPITVTAAAAANMAKALSFCQNILTSPTSKMAANFQETMTSAFKTGTIADGEKQIADFFNGYPTFAGLDFPSYVAVSTWLRGFAYYWGLTDNGKLGQTYYVYSAPDASKQGANSEGTIVFALKSDAPSPADPTNRQSGMTITLTSSSGSTTALTFQQSQVVDGAGAIALNCSFGFKGTFTNNESDTTVWPVLTGTMLNKPVIAIPLAPESGWDKFWTSLSFEKLLNYFLQAMGVWMALDFLKQKLSGKDKKLADDQANENEGNAPDQQQQNAAQNDGNQIGNDGLVEDQNLANRVAGDGNVNVPANDQVFNQAVDNVRVQGQNAYNQVAEDNIGGGLDSARAQLDDLAQIEVNPDIEEAYGNVVNGEQNLQSGNLSSANENLGSVNESLPNIVEELGEQVSQELRDQVKEAVDAQTEASEVADESSDNADEAGSGDEEPFDDPVVPEI